MKQVTYFLTFSLSLLLSSSGQSENNAALLIIDVQKCFVKGGNLAVPDGETLVPKINKIRERYESNFKSIYISLDYHPRNHVSFASQHINKKPFEKTLLNYNDKGSLCGSTTWKNAPNEPLPCSLHNTKTIVQELWPDHCIIDSDEVSLVQGLVVNNTTDKFIFKGNNPEIDSYSIFFDNGRLTQTPLHEKLLSENIKSVFMVGIATDYCVKFSALDAHSLGYNVYVVKDATKGVQKSSSDEAIEEMHNNGIHIINISEIEIYLGVKSEHTTYLLQILLIVSTCSIILLCFFIKRAKVKST